MTAKQITTSTTILHVLDHSSPIVSGYSVRSRDLIAAQVKLGQSVMVVTGPLHQVDDPRATDIVLDGAPYFRTAMGEAFAGAALRRRWPALREWQIVRLLRNRILEIIDEHPIDIVCAHSPALCGLAALQAARQRGLPFVYEIRAFWEDAAVDQERTRTTSIRYRLTRSLETYVVRRADAVSAIAQHILQELRSRGVSPDKLFHVPNGVDADRFSPSFQETELKEELGLPPGPVFGFFGSLYRYEGIRWLIGAMGRLRARGNQFSFILVGHGEEEGAIRAAIQDHNLTDIVRFVGRVPFEHIRRYYSAVDIMVFPRLSVRLTELVTPLKPLEAMALKKAVLASSVGGHRELIQHEATGLLFGPEDVEEFCIQAERLIVSSELREQLGNAGREYILREKDWKVLAQQYQRIYSYVGKNRLSPGQLRPESARGVN